MLLEAYKPFTAIKIGTFSKWSSITLVPKVFWKSLKRYFILQSSMPVISLCPNTCLWTIIPYILSHTVSWARCGTWLYRFLIFAFFHTLLLHQLETKSFFSNLDTCRLSKLCKTWQCVLFWKCYRLCSEKANQRPQTDPQHPKEKT